MSNKKPKHYLNVKETFPQLIQAVENLGEAARSAGPLDKKTTHLIQLAAAVTNRNEGAVHSHTRRLLEAGATPEEIRHAIVLLVSTIGFPSVMAGLSWAEDMMD
ncbi:MAG: carboxymuconolactone decarboxylase family protein [Bacteroidales bacterium]|nr:carboxymuconolactone decarboxylase family protein [Bacteroidales bacterium]